MAIRKNGRREQRARSNSGRRLAKAVVQLRPGKKPCYSAENRAGSQGVRRATKILIKMRYQVLVTLIGLRLAGLVQSRFGLGIAVSRVANRGGAAPSSKRRYRDRVTQAAATSSRKTTLSTPSSMPNTPVAVEEDILSTASLSSATVRGKAVTSKQAREAGGAYTKSDRKSGVMRSGALGRLKAVMK